jgi:hypothetical protein
MVTKEIRELEKKAQDEYRLVLEECYRRKQERSKELDEKGIQPHLDGENHYQDIDDWHKIRVKEIKRKYFG